MTKEVSSTLVGMQAVEADEPEVLEEAQQPAKPVHRVVKAQPAKLAPMTRPRAENEPAFLPEAPRTIAATGLSASYLESLCLKHLFQAGDLRGGDIAQRTCLPTVIVEEIMERLRKQRLVDLKGSGGTGLGRSQIIFAMTEAAREVVELSMERDRYVGPAPVPFKYYTQAVAAQSIRGAKLQRDTIAPHFRDLVLDEGVFDAIGPAMNSGKALFFYGAPGNGKTAVCQRMTNCFGGDVFIPHAIIVDDFVIKVFDETLHKPVPQGEGPNPLDARWVRCKRPMVVVGGELDARGPRPQLLAGREVLRGAVPAQSQLRDAAGRRLRPPEGQPQGPPEPVDRPAGERVRLPHHAHGQEAAGALRRVRGLLHQPRPGLAGGRRLPAARPLQARGASAGRQDVRRHLQERVREEEGPLGPGDGRVPHQQALHGDRAALQRL
ncbi:MAG: hypothetical protein QM765_52055 [Myxococcales bacterium]